MGPGCDRGGSAFNVKAESLRLGDFSPAQVATLGGNEATYSEADFEYVRDLGPVARGPDLRSANPIYGGVLPRVLISVLQHAMSEQRTASWVNADGGLKMDQRISSGTNQHGTCSKVLQDCTICASSPFRTRLVPTYATGGITAVKRREIPSATFHGHSAGP